MTSCLAPPTLEGIRILVVEADPDTRDAVVATLIGVHAKVWSARSVTEARGVLEKDDIDVMIIDLAIAGEAAHPLIRHVRATEAPARPLFAIALTADTRGEHRARALAWGFDVCVPKPVDPAHLTALIAGFTTRDIETE